MYKYITDLDRRKLGIYGDKIVTEEVINSIITLMKLNSRTWKQTINNRGKIIWKNRKSGQK